MGGIADDLRRFLPYYIPASREAGFIAELKKFPDPAPFYKSIPDPEPLQGDLWHGFLLHNPERDASVRVTGMIVSNSCDLAGDNKRLNPLSLAFAPCVSLARYGEMLSKQGIEEKKILTHLVEVRNQRVSHLFFMPGRVPGLDEQVVFLDKVQSLPVVDLQEKLSCCRLVSLSDVGFYLFIFKLSIHFCRIHEEIDRTPTSESAEVV